MFLSPTSAGVLWVHTLFSLLYLCITVIFVVHYSLKLGKYQQELVSPLLPEAGKVSARIGKSTTPWSWESISKNWLSLLLSLLVKYLYTRSSIILVPFPYTREPGNEALLYQGFVCPHDTVEPDGDGPVDSKDCTQRRHLTSPAVSHSYQWVVFMIIWINWWHSGCVTKEMWLTVCSCIQN